MEGGSGNLVLWNLLHKISGLVFVRPDIPALKYSISMESVAVNCFRDLVSEKHSNFQLKECGLFLDRSFPVIGASPDRIVSCSCCAKSCLEVRCPININHTSLNDPRIDLQRSNGNLSLKRNHRYHTQCQMQMAFTGLKTCYFFVWTPHGSFLETIDFDAEFWDIFSKRFLIFMCTIWKVIWFNVLVRHGLGHA